MSNREALPPLPPGVEPVSASNERSPNRQPRYRTTVKLWLTRAQESTFLAVFELTGSMALACASLKRERQTVLGWARDNPDFHARWDAALARRAELVQAMRDDLTPVAVGVVEDTLADREDKRLRFDAAKSHLRGIGFWQEKVTAEMEHRGGVTLIVEHRSFKDKPSKPSEPGAPGDNGTR